MNYKRDILVFCLYSVLALSLGMQKRHEALQEVKHPHIRLFMQNVHPTQPDDYYCTAHQVEYDEAFIVRFEHILNNEKANYMMLFGCDELSKEEHGFNKSWNCDRNDVCKNLTILYGLARDTNATEIPPDVGFRIGRHSPNKYLVLQVHYTEAFFDDESDSSGMKLHLTLTPQKYMAGIHVLFASRQTIPPGQERYRVDVNCRMNLNSTITLFAYRVHTHSLGVVVTGYAKHNDSWTFLARGNPHWPQAFYPMDNKAVVGPGDVLAARCTYNTYAKTEATDIGSATDQEMCNLYLMYYTATSAKRFYGQCEDVELDYLRDYLPSDSDKPLPPNPALEGKKTSESSSALNKNGNDNRYVYKVNTGWPTINGGFRLGQVVAVAVDKDGNVVVFHRGSHIWSQQSFDYNHYYQRVEEGPIKEPTIITFDAGSGHVLHSWGSDMFFMPHGLTVDDKGFIWITDVALHQIHKYSRDGRSKLLELGERFKPGSDSKHFCKPTSVAVTLAGDFFVADGYCNARVLHFNEKGEFKDMFGKQTPYGIDEGTTFGFNSPPLPPPETFNLPHKVVLSEQQDLLCVADRVNKRVQCFSLQSYKFRFQISEPQVQGEVYSISYSPADGGLLYAVCGPQIEVYPSKAFVFNISSPSQELVSTFTPTGGTFTTPHDIAVTSDKEEVYVAEIGPNKIWKFNREFHKTKKKILEPHIQVSQTPPKMTSSVNAKSKDDPIDNFGVSVVIMALLAIPILVFIIITVIVRLRKRGSLHIVFNNQVNWWLGGSYQTPKQQNKFDIGKLLNPHKGFDRVALNESDAEGDGGSDSDIEEFNAATRKA